MSLERFTQDCLIVAANIANEVLCAVACCFRFDTKK